MYYLRNVVSDVKLKYRSSRVVHDCITKREQPEFHQLLTECVTIADGHPELTLTTLHEYLHFRQPENAYGGLLLLEQLVSLCNYGFHLALAKDYSIQDRIIQLAIKRGEGEAHRKAQRLARLTLLEYSRVFVDDRELLRLSSLASSFEHRTRKSLLRCLNVQNRKVRFRDVDKADIIPISPKESLGSTSGNAVREVTPLRLSSAPEVWPCHVCTYLNAPSATRCAACETLRSSDTNLHRYTPQGTPKATPHHSPHPAPSADQIPSSFERDEEETQKHEAEVKKGAENKEGEAHKKKEKETAEAAGVTAARPSSSPRDTIAHADVRRNGDVHLLLPDPMERKEANEEDGGRQSTASSNASSPAPEQFPVVAAEVLPKHTDPETLPTNPSEPDEKADQHGRPTPFPSRAFDGTQDRNGTLGGKQQAHESGIERNAGSSVAPFSL